MPGAGAGAGAAAKTFDTFSGYSERLFADSVYEADDAEADRVYGEVEARMEGRNKRRREMREEEEAKRAKLDSSRIGDQFADLKRGLSSLRSEDWEAIPEIGDRSLAYKKKQQDVYVPVPDAIISSGGGSGAGGGGVAASVQPGASSMPTDLRGLSEARGQMLDLGLKRMSDSVAGQTVVDPKGYLTELGGAAGPGLTEADIADVKKARLLLKSVITTNPHHGPGWIAAARLEEQVRALPAARKIIREGCEQCPQDEDVWMEAARLAAPGTGKLVLSDAVRALPSSVSLWLRAAEYEGEDTEARKAVLRKALTLLPGSEALWKAAVALESPDDARIMLARAVECVPSSIDLWLALARLESYENAQRVLNQARQAMPTEPLIWVTAARLEEAQGNGAHVDKIVSRALKSLSGQGVLIDREAWLKHGEEAERAGATATATALVKAVVDAGVEEVDRRRTWVADAEALEGRGSLLCARAVYARALADYPSSVTLWLKAAELERRQGDAGRPALIALLRQAVSHVPTAEVLWLMAAKEAWVAGSLADARTILREAYAANPESEAIILAAVKLEWEAGEYSRARALTEKARAGGGATARVWQKAAQLEREVGEAAAEENLLRQGVTRYPTAAKLWMMLGQLYERIGSDAAIERAREAYSTGLKACPTSVPLWKLAARLEERTAGPAKARTVLEAGRQRVGKAADLWLESVRLERRAGNGRLADTLLARAMQECPGAGRLLAEDIDTAPRHARKRKSMDALKGGEKDNDPHVVLAVARLFWAERKTDKARKWFSRACALDGDLGDAWIWWAAFEKEQRDAVTVAEVEGKVASSAPKHGERWTGVSKVPGNRKMSPVQVLQAAVAVLQADMKAVKSAMTAEQLGSIPGDAAGAASLGAGSSSSGTSTGT